MLLKESLKSTAACLPDFKLLKHLRIRAACPVGHERWTLLGFLGWEQLVAVESGGRRHRCSFFLWEHNRWVQQHPFVWHVLNGHSRPRFYRICSATMHWSLISYIVISKDATWKGYIRGCRQRWDTAVNWPECSQGGVSGAEYSVMCCTHK